MTAVERGVLDTSVFIAAESGRQLAAAALPAVAAVSVVTVAELQAGVLAAATTSVRSRRLTTLAAVADIEVLNVDEAVTLEWARIRVSLAEAGRRLNVNDSWIAATALAHGLAIITQDDNFDHLTELTGLAVVRV
ncbi:MAG: PIN domain-containing protein [Nocardioidaceae bacterium]